MIGRRLAALALAAAALLPLHRLLDPDATGLAGAATRSLAEALWQNGLIGAVSVVVVGGLLTKVVTAHPLAWARRPVAWIESTGAGRYAAFLAAVSTLLSGWVALAVFDGKPTSVDSMVQLLHARALLDGGIGLQLPGEPAAWMIQNSVLTPSGWVSIYPPTHTALLALGLAVGAAWVVGPIAVGATSAFAFLALDRLAPEQHRFTRLAGAAIAVSPFVVLLGASHLSHATAAALVAVLLWTLLVARDGSWAWALAAGACAGALVSNRPWTGLVLTATLTAATWLWPRGQLYGGRWLFSRCAAMGAGGVPFALGLFWWNRTLFGHPWRLGYDVAFGPSHGLGLHPDPWGNAYGPLEALAYTGTDLLQLGANLIETPFSALLVIAAGLLILKHRVASFVMVTWALSGVAANAVYWHHGTHLGPRMLYETAPAWTALWVGTLLALGDGASPLPPLARRFVGWIAVLSVLGAVALIPARLRAVTPTPDARMAAALPTPDSVPALVFVHGPWTTRIAARLASAGMRRDSLETALRRNDTCTVDRYARWRGSGRAGPAPDLDLTPTPGRPGQLERRLLSPGNSISVRPGAPFDAACARQAAADRVGALELEPLLWQATPVAGQSVIVARDLGPVTNEGIRATYPGRSAWVAVDGGPGQPPRLLPYEEGMELIWRGAAALALTSDVRRP